MNLSNIDDKQVGFIRLLMRSPDKGDGWRSVSNTLRKFATDTIAAQPELYETNEDEGAMMIRLSERGKVLADYA